MKLTPQQLGLLLFIQKAHEGQTRKYTGEPYWNHPYAVAEIVHTFCPDEPNLIEIALCHDLFEDTKIQRQKLLDKLIELDYPINDRIFILNGVEALTDTMTTERYPDFNRKMRKEFEANRLSKIDGYFQTVKYADLIHNTQSLSEHDKNFAKIYLAEKRYMLNLMRNGSMELFVECFNSLTKAEAAL